MGVALMKIASPSSSSTAGGTASNGQNSESARTRNTKLRISKAYLPAVFPLCLERAEYVRRYDKIFVPCLLSWAGAQDDPFGTNGKLNTDVLSQLCQCIYPGVEIEPDGLEILQGIVRPFSQDSSSRFDDYCIV